MNGVSPVCTLVCRIKSSERVKPLPQSLHRNGRSPNKQKEIVLLDYVLHDYCVKAQP